MIKLRCSQLPLVFKCASQFSEALKHTIDIETDAAKTGTLWHEIFRIGLETRCAPEMKILLGAMPDADPAEIEKAAVAFRWVLKHLNPDWAHTLERKLAWTHGKAPERQFSLSGHPDVLLFGPDDEWGEIGDWKTGYLHQDHPSANWQTHGYLIMANLWYPKIENWRVWIYYPRLYKFESHEFSVGEIHSLRERLVERMGEIRSESTSYTPGLHCEFCSARHVCPALHADIAPFFAAPPARSFASLTQAEKSKFTAGLSVAEKICADARGQVKNWAKMTGPIPLEGGKEYASWQEIRRKIVPALAWSTLSARCGQFLSDAVKVSIKSAQDAAKENIRDKTAGRTLLAELESAGAIAHKPITKCGVRNVKADKSKENDHGE